jgi:hypothetical protein
LQLGKDRSVHVVHIESLLPRFGAPQQKWQAFVSQNDVTS